MRRVPEVDTAERAGVREADALLQGVVVELAEQLGLLRVLERGHRDASDGARTAAVAHPLGVLDVGLQEFDCIFLRLGRLLLLRFARHVGGDGEHDVGGVAARKGCAGRNAQVVYKEDTEVKRTVCPYTLQPPSTMSLLSCLSEAPLSFLTLEFLARVSLFPHPRKDGHIPRPRHPFALSHRWVAARVERRAARVRRVHCGVPPE
jgi:hypothetical protein